MPPGGLWDPFGRRSVAAARTRDAVVHSTGPRCKACYRTRGAKFPRVSATGRESSAYSVGTPRATDSDTSNALAISTIGLRLSIAARRRRRNASSSVSPKRAMSRPLRALDDLPPFERLAELAVLLEARDRDVERGSELGRTQGLEQVGHDARRPCALDEVVTRMAGEEHDRAVGRPDDVRGRPRCRRRPAGRRRRSPASGLARLISGRASVHLKPRRRLRRRRPRSRRGAPRGALVVVEKSPRASADFEPCPVRAASRMPDVRHEQDQQLRSSGAAGLPTRPAARGWAASCESSRDSEERVVKREADGVLVLRVGVSPWFSSLKTFSFAWS